MQKRDFPFKRRNFNGFTNSTNILQIKGIKNNYQFLFETKNFSVARADSCSSCAAGRHLASQVEQTQMIGVQQSLKETELKQKML